MEIIPVSEMNRTLIRRGRQEWRKRGFRDSGR